MEKFSVRTSSALLVASPRRNRLCSFSRTVKHALKKRLTSPVCANKGCNNKIQSKNPKIRFCNSCYIAHKKKSEPDEDSAALASVPDYVRKQTREKTLLKLKKKMAQMHTSKKSGRRVVLLAEADALIAITRNGNF
jgi:hypothetical protein